MGAISTTDKFSVVRIDDKTTVVRPNIDKWAVPQKSLSEILESEPKSNLVVLDLKNVKIMDSAVLGDIVKCYLEAKRVGGNLYLRNSQDHISRKIETVGLKDRFSGYNQPLEAEYDI